MYGVERSVVALARPDGSVEGKSTLEVKGSVGDNGVGVNGVGVPGAGVVVFRPGTVTLLGRSHAVCRLISCPVSTA